MRKEHQVISVSKVHYFFNLRFSIPICSSHLNNLCVATSTKEEIRMFGMRTTYQIERGWNVSMHTMFDLTICRKE